VADDETTDSEQGEEASSEEREGGLVGRVQRAWKASVGTYATDEGETRNLLQRLVEFGHLSQKEAKDALGEMRDRIEENRRELDRRVDESLKTATARLTIPSHAEIERLQAKVDELESKLSEMESRRG
jgi:poly(hydroxyalkanoate) granule-associated protein